MKKYLALLFLIFCFTNTHAQNFSIDKIEPPNWWVGMKMNNVQLMVYGNQLINISASFSNEKIKVVKVHKTNNPSYAFIDIQIDSELQPGNYALTLTNDNEKISFEYPVLQREGGKRFQGFDQQDIIYLIMPDRFADGDKSNNKIPGYFDYMDTIKNQGRAGGDIQGMIDRLDYLKGLGITAIWPTPLVENNTFRSYHGYAATDFYKIDPRLGSNLLYKEFVKLAHDKGIKVILDHVANHFSDDHVWMKNPPTTTWINGTKEKHLGANHSKMVFTDIHGDSTTIKQVEQGWFVDSMPDLNQEDPFVQNYIIQNTIWWIEFAGLDGIREDTYPYNNQKFMSTWAKSILDEFPTINIVGEVWTGEADFLASYQKDTFLPRSFNTNLPALTDFPLRDALINFLVNGNLYGIFNVLAKDFLYNDSSNLVTFADNHDLARVMYFANGNVERAKILYTILFTTRGIPTIFYGSEIGMVGENDHGALRIPFPGGFEKNQRNAFAEAERTVEENDIFYFLKNLINLRKNHSSLKTGKLIHFPVQNNIYVYFRIEKDEAIMIVINANNSEKEIDLNLFDHIIQGRKMVRIDQVHEKEFGGGKKLVIQKQSAEIYLLK